jgi:hypothetical protein
MLYAFSGVALVLVQVILVEGESALFYVIVTSITLPTTRIAFAMPALVGKAAQPIDWWTIISMFGILTGTVLYKLKVKLCNRADSLAKQSAQN